MTRELRLTGVQKGFRWAADLWRHAMALEGCFRQLGLLLRAGQMEPWSLGSLGCASGQAPALGWGSQGCASCPAWALPHGAWESLAPCCQGLAAGNDLIHGQEAP